MKSDIHPEYGEVTIQCACGASHTTRSTVQGTIQVDICSQCHPFFTGKQKYVDTTGRIDRLKRKYGSKMNVGSAKKSKSAGSSIREKLRQAAQGKPKEPGKEEGR